jgi:hypothetical protein
VGHLPTRLGGKQRIATISYAAFASPQGKMLGARRFALGNGLPGIATI